MRSSGGRASLVLSVLAVAAAILLFFTVSPFLGAIVMVGGVLGLGWAMVPAAIDRVARWLSVGR